MTWIKQFPAGCRRSLESEKTQKAKTKNIDGKRLGFGCLSSFFLLLIVSKTISLKAVHSCLHTSYSYICSISHFILLQYIIVFISLLLYLIYIFFFFFYTWSKSFNWCYVLSLWLTKAILNICVVVFICSIIILLNSNGITMILTWKIWPPLPRYKWIEAHLNA